MSWHLGADVGPTQTAPGAQHSEPTGHNGSLLDVLVPMQVAPSRGRSAHTPSLPGSARVVTLERESLQYCVIGHWPGSAGRHVPFAAAGLVHMPIVFEALWL